MPLYGPDPSLPGAQAAYYTTWREPRLTARRRAARARARATSARRSSSRWSIRRGAVRRGAAPGVRADALHQPRPAGVHARQRLAGASDAGGGSAVAVDARWPSAPRGRSRRCARRGRLAAAQPAVAELPVAARQPTKARRRRAARSARPPAAGAAIRRLQRQIEALRWSRAAGRAPSPGAGADRVRPRHRGAPEGRRTRLRGRQCCSCSAQRCTSTSRATSR